MKKIIFIATVALIFASFTTAQIPTATHIQILKAEDARRYDKTLEDLMKSPNAEVRERAALAAGRIGREEAIPALTGLLERDLDNDVRAMAAFALGETESIKAADAVLKAIKSDTFPGTGKGVPTLSLKPPNVTARLIEAAGKIAAANPKDESAKALGLAIVEVLEGELDRGFAQDRTTTLLGLTAILRAKPEGGEITAAKFLLSTDGRIRTDAGNTLTRLKAKNASANLGDMLENDKEPTARANAARALGAAEDKGAFDLLIKAATTDPDGRVRVSAIRALGSLNDPKAADKLLARGNELLTEYTRSNFANPAEKSELLEIISTLGRLLQASENEPAIKLIRDFVIRDQLSSPEAAIALARLSPKNVLDLPHTLTGGENMNWRAASGFYQAVGETSSLQDTAENKLIKSSFGLILTLGIPQMLKKDDPKTIPEAIRAFVKFDSKETGGIILGALKHDDIFIRATSAELLADQPKTNESVEALKLAFTKALLMDKHDNDAQLAILDALFKLDKKEAVGTLLVALNAPDYLVRKKAFEQLADKDLHKDFPGIPTSIENARAKHKDQVLPYLSAFGTKLGQVLNTDADYRRALSRKNGSVKAVLTTEKGTFTIVFNPEEAPLTVDNFIKLARSGYFNGLEVHRVVPNFVMQDGDPRGDGNGGPAWSIRCEVNMLPYDRGAVGMALSGKDAGGSQWFVTHSPQPHLDGGYTVFGRVDETGMKVVDNIVRGDKIISVKIIESNIATKRIKNAN